MVHEGVARGIDPDHDIWAAAEPIVKTWVGQNLGQTALQNYRPKRQRPHPTTTRLPDDGPYGAIFDRQMRHRWRKFRPLGGFMVRTAWYGATRTWFDTVIWEGWAGTVETVFFKNTGI